MTMDKQLSPQEKPLLLTVTEVTKLLGIGKSTLYELKKSKHFPPCVKLGQVRKSLWSREKIEMWVRLNCPTAAVVEREINKVHRRKNQRQVKVLSDTYVKQLLSERSILATKDVKELVALKREFIKLKRFIIKERSKK